MKTVAIERAERELWGKFLESLLKANSVKELEDFFSILMTSHERLNFAKRLMAIAMFHGGSTYRETSERLYISPNTIRSLRRSLVNRGLGYKTWHETKKTKLSPVDQAEGEFSRLLRVFFKSILRGKYSSWRWVNYKRPL